MADDNKKAETDRKQEIERREAEQKKLRDEQTAKTYEQQTPSPTQAEADATRANKERAEQSAKEVQERVAKAYDHETPTPTQAECDEAMLAAMHQQELPEGSGMTPATKPGPDESQSQKRKQVEADKSGGYQTRGVAPAASAKPE